MSQVFKTIYLIDSENEGRNALNYVLELDTDAIEIYYFYSEKSIPMAKKDMERIFESEITVHAIHCDTGRNAMDFQLLAYLGLLFKEDRGAEFIILSNDHGYDAAIEILCSFGARVRRFGVKQGSTEPENAASVASRYSERIRPSSPVNQRHLQDMTENHFSRQDPREQLDRLTENKKPENKNADNVNKDYSEADLKTIKFLQMLGKDNYDVKAVTGAAIRSKGDMHSFQKQLENIIGIDETQKFFKGTRTVRKKYLELVNSKTTLNDSIKEMKKALDECNIKVTSKNKKDNKERQVLEQKKEAKLKMLTGDIAINWSQNERNNIAAVAVECEDSPDDFKQKLSSRIGKKKAKKFFEKTTEEFRNKLLSK